VGVPLRGRKLRKRLSDIRSANGDIGARDRIFKLYCLDSPSGTQVVPAAVTNQVGDLYRIRRQIFAVLDTKAFESDRRERCCWDEKLKGGASRPSLVVLMAITGRTHVVNDHLMTNCSPNVTFRQAGRSSPISEIRQTTRDIEMGIVSGLDQ
jgi:hypothetical protein